VDPGDPVSHDNDTSYRRATQPQRGDLWYCATGKPAIGAVYASTANIRYKGTSGYTPGYSVGFYSGESLIGSVSFQSATADYANFADTETPSVSQVQAATFGVGYYTDGVNPTDSRVTSAWISLSYDPAEGTCILIWHWILPLLGSAIGMEHMPAIARVLWRQHGQGVPPEEYARVLRSLKEWRRPCYSPLRLSAVAT